MADDKLRLDRYTRVIHCHVVVLSEARVCGFAHQQRPPFVRAVSDCGLFIGPGNPSGDPTEDIVYTSKLGSMGKSGSHRSQRHSI